MDEEAILKLVRGNEDSSTPVEVNELSSDLEKVASMEGMPEEIAMLIKEASIELEEKEKELEYIKLAYEMASDGLVPWEGMYEKAAELKDSGKSPDMIREAMKLGAAIKDDTPFGEASNARRSETSKSGMYSVLSN